MPRVCRSHWNLMAWADPKRIYTTKATLGFKRNPKEFAWATNIKCNLLSQLSLSIFHELLVEWVLILNVEVVYSRFSIKHYSQNPHKTRSWSNSKVKTGTSYLQWSTTAKTVKTANNAKTNKKRSSDQVFHHTNNQIQCQETEERPHHVTIPSNKSIKH